MKPQEFKNFNSVDIYDEKTAETYRNCYDAKKRIVPNLSKISIPNFNIINLRDLNEDCVKISRPYLLYYLRNKLRKSVAVRPGRFKC